jgi:hypothetical protein
MTAKHAYGFCDRTGFRYNKAELVEEFEDGRPTGRFVGKDMVDPDHPQNHLDQLRLDDPKTLPNVRPDQSLRESRALFSWRPVGVGNLRMRGKVGAVTVVTD